VIQKHPTNKIKEKRSKKKQKRAVGTAKRSHPLKYVAGNSDGLEKEISGTRTK